MNVKNIKFGICFVEAMKILGAAWVGFGVSILPLYIWRGNFHGDMETLQFGQHLIMALTGLAVGFIALVFLYGRSDEAERLSGKETCIVGISSVCIYVAVWMISYILNANNNNYWVSTTGYNLGGLFFVDGNDRPTMLASFLSALIFGADYFFAFLLGGKWARSRRKENLKELK